MIFTVKYFRENSHGTFYEKMGESKKLEELDDEVFFYYNDENLIEKFKKLLHPGNSYNYTMDDLEFKLACFYLFDNEYIIKELPNLLSYPHELGDASDKIRTKVYESNPEKYADKVPWAERRAFANNLTITLNTKRFVETSSDLKKLLSKVSGADLSTIGIKHKEIYIRSLNEAIENILKQGNKFDEIDSDIFEGLITNEDVIEYRKLTHVFRHGNEKSLKERKKLEPKYDFLIRYGITILEELIKKD